MTVLDLAPLEAGLLSARVLLEGQRLRVALLGEAGLPEQDALEGFLDRIFGAAREFPIEEVEMDFRHLEFMNSSCLAVFVAWIDRVRESEPSYRIRFLASEAQPWQRRSLRAFQAIARDVVVLDA